MQIYDKEVFNKYILDEKGEVIWYDSENSAKLSLEKIYDELEGSRPEKNITLIKEWIHEKPKNNVEIKHIGGIVPHSSVVFNLSKINNIIFVTAAAKKIYGSRGRLLEKPWWWLSGENSYIEINKEGIRFNCNKTMALAFLNVLSCEDNSQVMIQKKVFDENNKQCEDKHWLWQEDIEKGYKYKYCLSYDKYRSRDLTPSEKTRMKIANTGYFDDDNRWKSENIYKIGNKEITIFEKGFAIDWDGNVTSKISSEAQYRLDRCVNKRKSRRNNLAKGRYHNNRVSKLLEQSIKLQDYSELKPSDVFYLHNVTHRTHLINYFGMDKVLKECNSKVIDSDTIGGRPYNLVVIEIPDFNNGNDYKECPYLEMINPSTGESHLEGVDPNIKSVRTALAWRDGEINVNWAGNIKSPDNKEFEDADSLYVEPVSLT